MEKLVPDSVMLILEFEKPNAPYSVMGDLWRRAAKTFGLHEERFIGFQGMRATVEDLPSSLNEVVTVNLQKALTLFGLPISPNLVYGTFYDKKNGVEYGYGLALRPTPLGLSEAPRHRGVVLRCARCGDKGKSFTVQNSTLDTDQSLQYAICLDCNKDLLGHDTIVTCWCGYRFLSGFARWYFQSRDSATCPNCGIRLQGSGAVKTELFGFRESL